MPQEFKQIVKDNLPHQDDYLLNLQTNNYSQETIYNYERDLKIFSYFLDDIKIPFQSINKQTINQFKAYLNSVDRFTPNLQESEIKLNGFSINRILSSLRSYIKYLVEMDYKVSISAEMIKLVKTDKKHPQVPEMNELIKLIESPTKLEKNKVIALRNRAMLETLFATGMRISELINLNRNQIDYSGRIFIKGKGKKERFVYLTPRACDHINNYLKVRNDNNLALFIPYRGKNANNFKKVRISTNYLQEKIKIYREILKINLPISAHTLRHGFATYLAESGANPAAIQILLGHESLDTTTRYVHASDRYAEDTHHKFHPLNK